jgi:hypothetical protein
MKPVRAIATTLLVLTMSASGATRLHQSSLLDRTIDISISVAKALWDRIQKEGKPLAERLLKAAPEYYKGTQRMVNDFTKRVEKADFGKTVTQKKEFILELWRLRSAINIMSLTDPAVLEQLTGVKPELFKKMLKNFEQTEAKAKKIPGSGV